MNKKGFAIIILLLILLTGCKSTIDTNEFELTDESSEEESFSGETIGELSHGVSWSEDETDYILRYQGGVMKIPYQYCGSGVAKNVGFLIYINGIAQPYKLEGISDEDKYLQVIEGEDSELHEFVFSFIPITGQQGETAEICIESVTNPDFKPDLKNDYSYGFSHKTLEAKYDLYFDESVDLDFQQINTKNRIIEAEVHSDICTSDIKDSIISNEEYDLQKEVYFDLIIDGKTALLDEKYDITNQNEIEASMIIFGHPGVTYRVSWYLDHMLLTGSEEEYYDIELLSEKYSEVKVRIDTSELDGNTLYVVAVPINADDFPEDSIQTIKTSSIYLFTED